MNERRVTRFLRSASAERAHALIECIGGLALTSSAQAHQRSGQCPHQEELIEDPNDFVADILKLAQILPSAPSAFLLLSLSTD